jgi:hypothetical protein
MHNHRQIPALSVVIWKNRCADVNKVVRNRLLAQLFLSFRLRVSGGCSFCVEITFLKRARNEAINEALMKLEKYQVRVTVLVDTF